MKLEHTPEDPGGQVGISAHNGSFIMDSRLSRQDHTPLEPPMTWRLMECAVGAYREVALHFVVG